MRIEISRRDGQWYADCPELPGSPPVGYGEDLGKAVGDLVVRLHNERRIWGKYVTIPEMVKIDDER